MKNNKKKVLFLLLFTIMISSACATTSENQKTGLVVYIKKRPFQFEIVCDDGEHLAFLINDDTKLIWEDQSALKEADKLTLDSVIDYDEWDVFGENLYVAIDIGNETNTTMHLSNDYIQKCYLANTITVTDVSEAYVIPFLH